MADAPHNFQLVLTTTDSEALAEKIARFGTGISVVFDPEEIHIMQSVVARHAGSGRAP